MYQPQIGHGAQRSQRPTDEPDGGTATGTLSDLPDRTQPILADFLGEIANAMRSAAESQRSRIADHVSSTADRHVQQVRSRAEIEADALRRLADQDVESINVWAEAEIERIRGDADRRVQFRRRQLDDYLAKHADIIDHEVEGINGAVAEYQAQLDAFFVTLANERDPAAFARLAGTLPEPPNLDAAAGEARAAAVSSIAESMDDDTNLSAEATTEEPAALIGVMDPGESARLSEAAATDTEIDEDAMADVAGDALAASTVNGAEPAFVDEPGADDEVQGLVGSRPVEAVQQAARMLRSIAPWTSPASAETEGLSAEPDADATPDEDRPDS